MMEPTPQQRYFQYLAELEARNPSYSTILYRQPGIASLAGDGGGTFTNKPTEPTPGMYGVEDDPSAYGPGLGIMGNIGKTYGIMTGLGLIGAPSLGLGYGAYKAGKGLFGLIGNLFGGSDTAGPTPGISGSMFGVEEDPSLYGGGAGSTAGGPGEATTSAGSAADPGTEGDPF